MAHTARFEEYPNRIRFCLSCTQAEAENGWWDTSDDQKLQSFEEYVATLERNGYEITRYLASPHQILNYRRAEKHGDEAVWKFKLTQQNIEQVPVS